MRGEPIIEGPMFDVLKDIQGRVAAMQDTMADHTRQPLAVRENINDLQRADLSLESMFAKIEVRLDHIERRLTLVDA